jgi:AcrR family transcriptional regulator
MSIALSIVQAEPADITQRPPGRPRSENCRHRILMAADDLLAKRGFAKTSIDAIALYAGVSKATIYRWWPNKAAVVMEAILASTEAEVYVPDSPFPEIDIAEKIRRTISLFRSPRGAMIASLVGEAQFDAEIAEAYRNLVLFPRRIVLKDAIERAIKAGAFGGDIDLDLAVDIIYGPLYQRLLLRHAPLDDAFERDYPKMAIAALRGYAQMMGH